MEKELNEYQKQYLIEHLVDSFFVCDEQRYVIYFNKSLLQFLKYQEDELAKKQMDFFISDEEKERVRGVIDRVLGKGVEVRDFSTSFVTKEDKNIPVSIHCIPTKDIHRKITGFFVIVYDARQLQGLLKALKQSKGEMEKRVEERTKELQERVDELEKYRKVTVGRELKMKELKEKVIKMEKELKNYKSKE